MGIEDKYQNIEININTKNLFKYTQKPQFIILTHLPYAAHRNEIYLHKIKSNMYCIKIFMQMAMLPVMLYTKRHSDDRIGIPLQS